MVDINLFSTRNKHLPVTDTKNEAGGSAYSLSDQNALAQLAATGCLNRTFYADAETQLSEVLKLANGLPGDFVAKVAVFARERGYMKDMPALLTAVLAARRDPNLERVFKRVINNGKMLRNFVQIVRSGVTGRKSFGTSPKRLLREWFEGRSEVDIFKNSVGANPSMADVIKMIHPRPSTKGKEALYGWLIGKQADADAGYDPEQLPDLVKAFEAFKRQGGEPPAVPFEMLTALPLTKENWSAIARNAKWQWTRMNLNTMARHGVFENPEMVNLVADRLANRNEIQAANVFPYQLLSAYQNAGPEIPKQIRDALEEAMEISTENVPPFKGKVYVCVDVSGSMSSAITGSRKGSTSKTRCVDVAALISSIFLRRSEDVKIIPFADRVRPVELDAKSKIIANTQKIAAMLNGGTNCSAPLGMLNEHRASGDLVVIVSDNQSWVDSLGVNRYGFGRTSGPSRLMVEWDVFKKRNAQARMVCVDIQPYTTTQAQERGDIMNIGGWSDSCLRIIHQFSTGELNENHWVGEIEKIDLDVVEDREEVQKK